MNEHVGSAQRGARELFLHLMLSANVVEAVRLASPNQFRRGAERDKVGAWWKDIADCARWRLDVWNDGGLYNAHRQHGPRVRTYASARQPLRKPLLGARHPGEAIIRGLDLATA